MRIILILFLFVFSCGPQKKIEIVESPNETKIASDGTIKYNNGEENARRMKYYNTIQHKSFYRHYHQNKKKRK
jgi:hypothetical protein